MRAAFFCAIIFIGDCRRFESAEAHCARIVTVNTPPASNIEDGCVDHYDPAFDYFPDKATFRYAKQLQISYHRNYKVIDFTPAVHTQETFRFVLVQCGTPAPTDVQRAHVIQVPVRRVVLNVPEMGAAVVLLGVVDRLVGVMSFLAYTTPEILERGKKGLIQEVGSRGHSPLEPTIAINPDLVFLFYSAYPNANLHPQLRALGVEGAPLAGHFEPHPLGRTEWIKFVALFFNKEREADELFAPAAMRYEHLASRAATVTNRPDVLLGFPTGRDVWSLFGGRNFMTKLVWDAGGQYFWHDEQAGSLVTADYERVLDESSGTGVWLGGYGVNRVATRRDLIINDARLAFFTPVERDGVYANDRGIDRRHAVPYADQSLDKPDIVLADFLSALHPEIVPDRAPVFIRKLN